LLLQLKTWEKSWFLFHIFNIFASYYLILNLTAMIKLLAISVVILAIAVVAMGIKLFSRRQMNLAGSCAIDNHHAAQGGCGCGGNCGTKV
jgi:hypothetical protein